MVLWVIGLEVLGTKVVKVALLDENFPPVGLGKEGIEGLLELWVPENGQHDPLYEAYPVAHVFGHLGVFHHLETFDEVLELWFPELREELHHPLQAHTVAVILLEDEGEDVPPATHPGFGHRAVEFLDGRDHFLGRNHVVLGLLGKLEDRRKGGVLEVVVYRLTTVEFAPGLVEDLVLYLVLQLREAAKEENAARGSREWVLLSLNMEDVVAFRSQGHLSLGRLAVLPVLDHLSFFAFWGDEVHILWPGGRNPQKEHTN